MQTNIETIYQQYIKPLSQEDRILLLARMAEELSNDKRETDSPKERSLLELEGLGAELWKGVDAQKYVDGLREEWERRP